MDKEILGIAPHDGSKNDTEWSSRSNTRSQVPGCSGCEKFDAASLKVKEMMPSFVGGGQILPCGTCLNLRHSQLTELSRWSTMKDLDKLIRDRNRVVSV